MNTWTTAARIRVGDHLHHDGHDYRVSHIAHEGRRQLRIYLASGVQILARPWSEFPIAAGAAREVSA